MDRDDKHARFAAAALNAILVVELAKPFKVREKTPDIVADAAWFADQLIQEVEKK